MMMVDGEMMMMVDCDHIGDGWDERENKWKNKDIVTSLLVSVKNEMASSPFYLTYFVMRK